MSHFEVVFGFLWKSGLTNLDLAFADGFSKIFRSPELGLVLPGIVAL